VHHLPLPSILRVSRRDETGYYSHGLSYSLKWILRENIGKVWNWLLLQACHNWPIFSLTEPAKLTYTWSTIFNLAIFLHFKTTLYHSAHLDFCPSIGSFYGHAKYSLWFSFKIDKLKLTSKRSMSFTLTSGPLKCHVIYTFVTGSGSIWRSKGNTAVILIRVPSIVTCMN
jgi:hypothetical protein